MKTHWAILSFIILLAINLNAAVLNVPDDFESIQLAINAAQPSDTVIVAPGTYQENLDFMSKPITVSSRFILAEDQAYIDSTIIDGDASGACASIVDVEDDEAVLMGFTIINGFNRDGGGIHTSNSVVTIHNCHIYRNTAFYFGGGVFSEYSDLFLYQCVIRENETDNGGGGGVYLRGGQCGVFRCDVSFNSADIIDGGGFFIEASDPVITATTIAYNSVDARGGGIFFTDDSDVTLRNTILWGNTPQQAWLFEDNRVTLYYCVIEGGEEEIVVDNPEAFLRWRDGNFFDDPMFQDAENFNLNLSWENFPDVDETKSPCIDGGDPEARNDPDETRADIGGYYFHQNSIVVIEPDTLTFDPTGINNSDWQAVTVFNRGGGTVRITSVDIVPNGTPFIVNDRRSFELEPGGSQEIWMQFAPRAGARYEAFLRLETDLEEKPVIDVPLIGWTLGLNDETELPQNCLLAEIHPNPFNGSCRIELIAPRMTNAVIGIYDEAGRRVMDVFMGALAEGNNSIALNAESLPSGLYFLKVDSDYGEQMIRMSLQR